MDAGGRLCAAGAGGDVADAWQLGAGWGRRVLPLPVPGAGRAAGGARPALLVGARVRLAEADWLGVRVDLFETTAGSGAFTSASIPGLGGDGLTRDRDGRLGDDAWQWLEASLDGPALKGRVYAEAGVARAWQVEAVTRQLQAGAFGPGGFPASGLAPVIDIRALEFVPLG